PISGREFMHYCEESGYHKLPIDDSHIIELENLTRDESAPAHNDPFDRIILSQAKAEGLTLLTHDPFFRAYKEPCVVEV
ncbi:MAG: type II toxin-antitoxin system VapC family toxin, partial [Treponema sp.]|nr:type II toxin-antitoxin system VapC family toxin [Treponema sp.]